MAPVAQNAQPWRGTQTPVFVRNLSFWPEELRKGPPNSVRELIQVMGSPLCSARTGKTQRSILHRLQELNYTINHHLNPSTAPEGGTQGADTEKQHKACQRLGEPVLTEARTESAA